MAYAISKDCNQNVQNIIQKANVDLKLFTRQADRLKHIFHFSKTDRADTDHLLFKYFNQLVESVRVDSRIALTLRKHTYSNILQILSPKKK